MNKLRLTLIILVLSLGLPGSLLAQQVFPVQVTGMLIPPNSLTLSDYASQRSNDIMYTLTLRDPIESSRLVKFRLIIENNGQEIMRTDPNFNAFPILLERDVPLMIDGGDLAPYFQSGNLINTSGDPAGLLLPEGFNAICLEVIDLERNVPISNKSCARGLFENADPPILINPRCGAMIDWAETQNMLFHWILPPSSNTATLMVEYEFTLVSVRDGQAPEEAFIAIPSQRILQETVNTTTFRYLEGQPMLTPGETYAWRVRAIDLMGSDLIDNDGYSPVCTFTLTEVDDPVDNPTYTCEGGPCNWLPPITEIGHSGQLAPDDEVKVGHFRMVLSEIAGSNNSGYTGKGSIHIPFLFSKIKVEFSNLKINEDLRVYEGEINSTFAQGSFLDGSLLADTRSSMLDLASEFTDNMAVSLQDYFDPAQQSGMVQTVSNLKNALTPEINLPLALDQLSDEMNLPLNIVITGASFNRESASLNAVLSLRLTEDSPWLKFGVAGVCLQPGGLSGGANSSMFLMEDADFELGGFPFTLKGLNDETEGTSVTWNCDGFDEFKLEGLYEFDEGEFENIDQPGQPVVGRFRSSTRSLTDIMATLDPIDAFAIADFPDFKFEVNSAWVDLSQNRNPEGITFPQTYPETDDNWTGLYLNNLALTLPEALSFTDDNTSTTIEGSNLLVDNNGVSGDVSATNFLTTSTDAFGDWGFTIEEIKARFLQNDFEEATVTGSITVPLISDPIGYAGSFTFEEPADGDPYYLATLNPAEDVTVGMSISDPTVNALEFTVFSTSTISATYAPSVNQFNPRAELCGGVAININENDFPSVLQDAVTEIKANLPGVANFNFAADFQMCLGIDPSLNLYEGQYFRLLDYSGTVSLPGMDPVDLAGALSLLQLELNYGIPIAEFPDSPNIPRISIPGYSDIDLTAFPSISLPNLSGLPDIPDFTIPNFEEVDLPAIPNFNIDQPFMPLGFNFHLPALPGISLDLGIWAISVPEVSLPEVNVPEVTAPDMAIPSIPSFDFALFNVEVNIPEFSCSPQNPLAFTLPSGTTGDVGVNFLSRNFEVTQDLVTQSYTTTNSEGFFSGLNLESLVDQFPEELKDMIDIPAAYNSAGIDLSIDGITFQSAEAAAIDVSLTFDNLVFEGALPIHPKGVSFDGARIALGSDADLSSLGLPGGEALRILGGTDDNGEEYSYISFNCSGIQSFHLTGQFDFPDEFVPTSGSGAVTATVSIDAPDWGDFIGIADIDQTFTIDGIDDFVFELNNAILDLSASTNDERVVFPEGQENTDNSWQGFYMEEIQLTLPSELSFTDDGSQVTFSGNHLLIDSAGVSGEVQGVNVLNLSSDAFGDWAFSLDTLGVRFLRNEFTRASINGGIGLPLMAEEIRYLGDLTYDGSDNSYAASLRPNGDITVGMDIGPQNGGQYLASMTVFEQLEDNITEIRGDYRNGSFEPSATICGGIQINLDEAVIRDYVSDDVMDVINEVIDPFSFNAALDICLNIDPTPDQVNGKFFDLLSYQGSVTLPGTTEGFSLDDALNLTEFMVRPAELPTGGIGGTGGIELAGYEGSGIDISEWPNITNLPVLEAGGPSGDVPDFTVPAIKVPDFTQFGTGGDAPNINLPDEFRTLGLTFNLPTLPGIGLTLGAWVVQDTEAGPSKFKFADLVFEITVPEFQCDPATVTTFDVDGSSIYVPFLGESLVVEDPENDGSFTTVSGDRFPFNLKDEIGDILPFSLDESLEEMGVDPANLPDFEITGITFFNDGTAIMTAELNMTIDDFDLELIGSLPIHPRGINFNAVKIGFKNDLGIGF